MVLDGIAYSFGVLLQPMQDDLQTSVGSVSLIGGVLAGVILATGPLAAGAANRCILGWGRQRQCPYFNCSLYFLVRSLTREWRCFWSRFFQNLPRL